MFGTESPDPVKLLPRNSKGDLSPSATDEIGTTLGRISIISETDSPLMSPNSSP